MPKGFVVQVKRTVRVINVLYDIQDALGDEVMNFRPIMGRVREVRDSGHHAIIALHLAHSANTDSRHVGTAASCAIAAVAQTVALAELHRGLELSNFLAAQIIVDPSGHQQLSLVNLTKTIANLLRCGAVPIVSRKVDVLPCAASQRGYEKAFLFESAFFEELTQSVGWRMARA
ncbi:hypothetical protein M446_4996 [Methylobacterium sp. 4-46]|uniref:hypothetical protein n=1 Tax=unclassified Methylobacterium TaxID=2615210 RepID=UPI000165CB9B|nr:MULTISPECIES: hypothetical protein [Methylobacterium]ACA19324.1 hypothetical protein M446_4996 [Methylobacterium sp. 4-46]WFT78526.1 hypothetical protein QA634_25110 [Methylobacterium nodulans]